MASISSLQQTEVTFLSGINSSGLLASESYWTWNSDNPATYDPANNHTAKFGTATIGTGATISYAFDIASNWNEAERSAFASTAALWSAVANVKFVENNSGSAMVTLQRGTDGGASGGRNLSDGMTGTANIGSATRGRIEIDTSAAGFGPLGSTFSEYGGYPYTTLIHEWGHVLGLGHGGAYDESLDFGSPRYTSFDSLPWTLMSYNDPASGFSWGTSRASDGLLYANTPVTPMPLDIVAIQRIYGVAIDTPLSGGQVYGFNSNITGPIARYFDFTQNSRPIVTLWNKGVGNTLDVSGFTTPSTIDLHDGAFSSVTGLKNDIAIAYGTRIDSAITGPGNDTIVGNDNSDVIMAGAGNDSITGGSGNDHLYGAASVAVQGDGSDTITGGAGNDYLQGNAGDDRLDGGIGSDRIQGGQGNDSIVGNSGNDSVNGNLGSDTIDGGEGNDSLRGGQGGDSIQGGTGNDVLMGDLGADTLAGGTGIDVLVGGGDADVFVFSTGEATFATGGALAYMTDMITDFTDGVDHIRLGLGVPGSVAYEPGAFDTLAQAAAVAQGRLDGTAGFTDIAVLKVGGDLYLFYDPGSSSPIEAVKLAGLTDPTMIGVADFI
ncbi:peptidase M10, serralysin-like protein [Sphingomonas histidinilytica]|jgi:serralysin|uniref:M10 family metallopeptidase C-terminal domain-containing protein n=1 Tax=Rhizorhabdus histidinilytica TaxID=439228 RepID=UPI000F7A23FA|nr:M10 family metallopeptidase C-terminal domain-containing protein [Rhizorhabdus histidinilytica]MBO9379530.1 peptidase M10, serralysin-like protein [Rhizorhabdus histidinilytica]QEH77951.1 peptidase M10, serralysin-like protein [Sphingomonas sp. C8-2]